jgi:hypothetical protein
MRLALTGKPILPLDWVFRANSEMDAGQDPVASGTTRAPLSA